AERPAASPPTARKWALVAPRPRSPGRRLRSAFFFSSRRRHTRFSRDWSSDVCSSDLAPPNAAELLIGDRISKLLEELAKEFDHRSEERRVGKVWSGAVGGAVKKRNEGGRSAKMG